MMAPCSPSSSRASSRGVRTQRALVLENLALRHQLAVLQRTAPRPRLRPSDRVFRVLLARLWRGWAEAVAIVQPETVIRWQRTGFRLVLDLEEPPARARPPRHRPGRPRAHPHNGSRQPPVGRAADSRGAPEAGPRDLPGDGVQVPGPPSKPPSQTWRTFLDNHIRSLVSVDFFTVPTVMFKVLFVFVVLTHDRRRVVHVNVTDTPTAEWSAQQLVEAFPWDTAPRYLLRDRDAVYGAVFSSRVQALGILEVKTTPRSPWQNPYVERLIGTLRRECLDHMVVLSATHLRRLLRDYLIYYHSARTHLSLDKDAPEPRAVERLDHGRIVETPLVGGLHHRYSRRAA